MMRTSVLALVAVIAVAAANVASAQYGTYSTDTYTSAPPPFGSCSGCGAFQTMNIWCDGNTCNLNAKHNSFNDGFYCQCETNVGLVIGLVFGVMAATCCIFVLCCGVRSSMNARRPIYVQQQGGYAQVATIAVAPTTGPRPAADIYGNPMSTGIATQSVGYQQAYQGGPAPPPQGYSNQTGYPTVLPTQGPPQYPQEQPPAYGAATNQPQTDVWGREIKH